MLYFKITYIVSNLNRLKLKKPKELLIKSIIKKKVKVYLFTELIKSPIIGLKNIIKEKFIVFI